MEQRSPEWHAALAGSLGASSVPEALAKTKTGWGAGRQNTMARLIVERMTRQRQEGYVTAAMQNGIDTEEEGRLAYQFQNDCDVSQIPFERHPTISWSHASPDGLIGSDGLVEIKCPQTAAHLEQLLGGGPAIPAKYITQMQWQMACTGRAWCDFVSYSTVYPEHMRLFIHRVPRDDKHIAELEAAVRQFLSELDEKVAALNERFGLREAA
jgi:putative phage-type endonuclease